MPGDTGQGACRLTRGQSGRVRAPVPTEVVAVDPDVQQRSTQRRCEVSRDERAFSSCPEPRAWILSGDVRLILCRDGVDCNPVGSIGLQEPDEILGERREGRGKYLARSPNVVEPAVCLHP